MLIADDDVRIVTVRSAIVHCPRHGTVSTELYNSTRGRGGTVVGIALGRGDGRKQPPMAGEAGPASPCVRRAVGTR